jgi:hypothetical protein
MPLLKFRSDGIFSKDNPSIDETSEKSFLSRPRKLRAFSARFKIFCSQECPIYSRRCELELIMIRLKATRMSNPETILEITDGKGKFLVTAPIIVLATMFHPDKPEQRRHFVETLSAKALIEIEAPIPRKLAIQASAAAAEAESVLDESGESAYGVAVAGDILLFVINAALYSPEHASVARAIAVWCEDQALGKTREGGYVAASPRSVKAAWSRFKPVAHLCGAYNLFHNDQIAALNPADPKTLLNFLAVAEALRKRGEAHHPPSGRKSSKPSRRSTLDPATTWKTPSNLALPKPIFSVPPLPDFAQSALRNYRAE